MSMYNECVTVTNLQFQSKVNNIGMYHTIVKDIDEYNGGSDLMHNMAQYVQRKPKKFKVTNCTWQIWIWNNAPFFFNAVLLTMMLPFVFRRNSLHITRNSPTNS